MGIGDDEDAGTDGCGGHDWGFEGISKEGDAKGRMLGTGMSMLYAMYKYIQVIEGEPA